MRLLAHTEAIGNVNRRLVERPEKRRTFKRLRY